MIFWSKKKDHSDNIKKFYHDVDRLTKLIEVALEKRQTKNAERYLKYFFETMVKYYIKSEKEGGFRNDDFFIGSSDPNTTPDERYFQTPQKRNIDLGNQDFFVQRITTILFIVLKQRDFEVFYFIQNLLNDTIAYLFNHKKLFNNGRALVSIYKFVTNSILTSSDPNKIQDRWFESYTYQWFITLYKSSSEESIDILESEIVYILRDYINNNRVDLFESFLLSLGSSSIDIYGVDVDDILKHLDWKDVSPFEFRGKLNLVELESRKIQNLESFQKEFAPKIDDLVEEGKRIGIKVPASEFKLMLHGAFFSSFKKAYLKVIVFKIVMYALFKEKYEFVRTYLDYHSPKDANAIWSNPEYNLKLGNELVSILEMRDKIVHDHSFWIGHHGFELYFDTLFFIILDRIPFQQFKDHILQNDKHEDLRIKKYMLEQMLNRKDSKVVESVVGHEIADLEKNIKDLIGKIEGVADDYKLNYILETDIDPDTISNFRNEVLDNVSKYAFVRSMIKYFGRLEFHDEESPGRQHGINTLYPKEAFIKTDVHFVDTSGSLARNLGNNEDRLLLGSLLSQSEKYEQDYGKLEESIKSFKLDYDVILVLSDRFRASTIFSSKEFVNSWKIDTSLNDLSFYRGKLSNHFEVLHIHHHTDSILLLDSKMFPNLHVYKPAGLPQGSIYNFFSFSLIDIGKDKQAYEQLSKDLQQDPKKLKSSVWLRIFESVELEVTKKPIHLEFT